MDYKQISRSQRNIFTLENRCAAIEKVSGHVMHPLAEALRADHGRGRVTQAWDCRARRCALSFQCAHTKARSGLRPGVC